VHAASTAAAAAAGAAAAAAALTTAGDPQLPLTYGQVLQPSSVCPAQQESSTSPAYLLLLVLWCAEHGMQQTPG
jgi:hypothetical protein